MQNGSFEEFFAKPSNRGQAKEHLLHWAIDIAQGLAHLHKHNLVHRDLAARNVFIDTNLRALIADFGLLRPCGDAHGKMYYRMKSDSRIPMDVAPEALRESKFSPASDVFNFGLTLFEIATESNIHDLKRPFAWNTDELSIDEVVGHLGESAAKGYPELFSQLPPWLDASLRQLMLRCIAFEPQNRPSAPQIVQLLQELSSSGSWLPCIVM